MKQLSLYSEDAGNGFTRVFGPCAFTRVEYSCKVPTEGLMRYLDGDHAQVAMPDVSPEDREFIISGISPMGWEKTFG